MKPRSFVTVAIATLLAAPLCHAEEATSNAIAALRTCRTASVRVEEWLIDNDEPTKYYRPSEEDLKGCFKVLLDAANIKLTEDAPDVVFTIKAKAQTRSDDYVKDSPSPIDRRTKIATGAHVKGTLTIERDEAVLHTIQFEGESAPLAQFVWGSLGYPILNVLGRSGLHRQLLAILLEARGPGLLEPIIEEWDGRAVDPDWSGGTAVYRVLFDVLASSRAPWAEQELQKLAEEATQIVAGRYRSSPRLAKEALERRKNDTLPNKVSEAIDANAPNPQH